MNIEYTINIEPELEGPEGFFATGDDEQDAKLCTEIRERLEREDMWAWCTVYVKATVEFEGEEFYGMTCLGGCSYKNEADFRTCEERGYFADMKAEALADLVDKADRASERGAKAERLIRELVRGRGG